MYSIPFKLYIKFMNNNYDESLKKTHKSNQQTAKKALESYLEQLKVHYELSDNEIIELLHLSFKSKKTDSIKRWWNIFK